MTIILYFLNSFIKPTYIQLLLLKQSFLRVLSQTVQAMYSAMLT